MTPEAVIDRYLEMTSRDPFDPTELALLLGTDADLLSRWLQLLDCPADPAAFIDTVSALAPERFHDLAMSQALAVLTVSGSVRLSFDQWQSVLNVSVAGEQLAAELGLPDPVAVRWRVLLAASGVNLPQDPLLTELLAFRGARPELLEDASAIHRLFAVVESLDVTDTLASQEIAEGLLGIDPERFQQVLASAEVRSRELLDRLDLSAEDDADYGERLWLRLQISQLGRLLPPRRVASDAELLDAHRLISRRLFGGAPELFLLDAAATRLLRVGGGGPDVALASQSSTIARSARERQRLELVARPDQSVADRQVLRHLGSDDGVCMPLADSVGAPVGVLVFAVDEDVDQETAMALYGAEVARRVSAPALPGGAVADVLNRFRQREEMRLRELAHEVNNPLSIVNNYLHILELKLEHEPEAVAQLRLIGGELSRAGDIISQVPEVPHLEADRPESRVDFSDLDLNALARRVVELHLGYAGEYRVNLSEHLVAGTLFVRTDEHRLAQILNNLVRNAIEAVQGASVTVSTTSGVYREGREGALISVSDTGPGLPREVLDRLAEPKQTSKGGEHSGLGLHIVHRLVDELRGSIDVRTSPGQGTAFSIFLPLDPGVATP